MRLASVVLVFLIVAITLGYFIKPPEAVPLAEVRYAGEGDAALIYDAHGYMRQFHWLRSLPNTSYRVERRGVTIRGVPCPRVDVVKAYTIYGIPIGRYWMGCVENGYV